MYLLAHAATSRFFLICQRLKEIWRKQRETYMSRISRALLIVLFSAIIAASQTRTTDNGWPRRFAVGPNSVAVYQPQLEEWIGNSLSARAAIAITENQNRQPLYGVLWFSARAEIDKINRLVTLSDFKVKKLSIPVAPDRQGARSNVGEVLSAFDGRLDGIGKHIRPLDHRWTHSTRSRKGSRGCYRNGASRSSGRFEEWNQTYIGRSSATEHRAGSRRQYTTG